jgi:predicted lysophospholipase L1 biosynthesis ABC-type transport system permease subunit
MRKRRVARPPGTSAPPALSWSMAALMSRRRLGRERGAAAIVALSVSLTVSASMVVTGMVSKSGIGFAARIASDSESMSFVRKALARAYLPWQAVSAMVALTAAAAVSCVLAVSFLGRKRSLGILKVIGATKSDFVRLLVIECGYLGMVGIPAGLLYGAILNRFALRAPIPISAVPISSTLGILALCVGAFLPLKLLRNATCDQLLNNKAVYAISNPSCAECGLCGGF